ncbi:E3 ubiquitin-protein ligase RLIM-like [Scleropages formosus]|uniref:RING-type E3 ubiquitin transferase n=1 Tax=Scleropages formosus TaxID=113540 RepID=A0A0P7YUM8_SCLFO|nr:E3 ubiquitin-protein ligase RLIM-like [Scleropages formosus]
MGASVYEQRFGEITEEELLRRLRQAKDGPLQPDIHENSGSDSQEDGSDGDSSLLGWLNSMRQTANTARSGYQGNQSWRAVSRTNPSSGVIRFSLEINVNRNTQQQADAGEQQGREGAMEVPSSEPEMLMEESSDSSASSVTEAATPTEEMLFERLLRGGRRRARSRSPEQSWTRPRRDGSPSSLTLNQTEGLPQARHEHAFPRLDPRLEAGDHAQFRTQEQLRFRHSSVEPEVLLGVVPEPVPAPQMTDDPGAQVEENDTSGQRPPTIMLDLQVRRVPAGEPRQQDGIASRTRSRYQASDASPHESNHTDFQHAFSRSDQAGVRTYVSTIRIPIRRVADTSQSESTSIETTVQQMLMGFGELSYLMDSVDPDSRQSAGPSRSPSMVTSASASDVVAAMSAASGRGSRPEEPQTQDREREVTPVAPATSGPREPISSLPFLRLAHFFLLSGDIEEQPRGLTKEQIDNLSMRNYGDSDALKTCSVCIMEYSQGNKLRKLPCSHEYHVHCIDRWLSENSTCPVCRRAVLGSSNRENVV